MPIGRYPCALASLAVLLASACNNAEVGSGNGEGSGTQPDAAVPDPPDIDASVVAEADADVVEPGEPDAGIRLLTHSSSLDVIGGVSVACFEAVNSYYRVFDLADPELAIDGDLHVTKVTFGVEECLSGSGGLPATVILSTLDGNLVLANLTQLASAETFIPDVAIPPEGEVGGSLHEVEIDAIVPAGSKLVVELTHRAFGADQSLLVGGNRQDLDQPTFLRAPACGESQPTPADQIEDENGDAVQMSWVLVVEATN